ncbi:MAG: PspC domain-containing protein, partial [Bacteroidota bacterium]
MPDQPKRLYRSRMNRVIAGVCGGFAEYLDIDPTLVRIAMVLLTIFGGWGILLYIAALILVPQNPSTGDASGAPKPVTDRSAILIIGITLVVLGFFFLFINLDFFSFRQITRFVWSYFLPAALIGSGIYLLMRRSEPTPEQPPSPPPAETRATEKQEPSAGRKK